jgi:hypothetical protein
MIERPVLSAVERDYQATGDGAHRIRAARLGASGRNMHMNRLNPKTAALLAIIAVGALVSGSAVLADDPAGRCGYYVNSNGRVAVKCWPHWLR